MNPQHTSEQEYAAFPCPTSPWTECFQDAPDQPAERTAFERGYDHGYNRDDQRPTHDALSDIYNREDE